MMTFSDYLEVKPEIRSALEKGGPVVALESTIIAHGMPYPQNRETALEVERIIRDHGALPASIAILDGKLRVGLTSEEIDDIARLGTEVVKTSRRDIPFLLAGKVRGATTVAATMMIAHLAGIKFFATGGIGGVHRGGENSLDISADLQELVRTPVYVICAGIKSILDLGLTLEYLETHGVPVIGFGCDDLPGFYTRKSGFQVNYRIDTVPELIRVIQIKEAIHLHGGMVIANPIPDPHGMDEEVVGRAIAEALAELSSLGISGKETTPYLLKKIKEITGGKSLEANIQLVYHNAKLAAELATSLVKFNQT